MKKKYKELNFKNPEINMSLWSDTNLEFEVFGIATHDKTNATLYAIQNKEHWR